MTSRFAPLRSRRDRRRVVLLCVIALLFAQLSIAAYACPMESVAATAMPSGCDVPDVPRDAEVPALCAAHCQDDAWSADPAKAPGVPALGPAPAPLPVFRLDAGARRADPMHPEHVHPPPLTILYLSLQI